MRNKAWIAEHRGGTLTVEQHKQAMRWAIDCINHLLPLVHTNSNDAIKNAVDTGNKWIEGHATTGDAIKASREILHCIKDINNERDIAIARAAGHAVATAHMADHSMGVVLYGLKALEMSGGSRDEELEWQIKRIPDGIKELVLMGLLHKKIVDDHAIKSILKEQI